MTSATRPTWRKLRKLLALIADGLPPQRAASVANLPNTTLDNPRIANAIYRAQARYQHTLLLTVNAAATGNGTTVTEGSWSEPASDGSRAPTRTRAWSKRDYRPATWLLERGFASEWGIQQPQQVASAVVDVLHALAALRDQPAQLAVHKPLALADGKQEHARAREGS